MKFQSLNSWLKEEAVKGSKMVDNQPRDHYGCLMMQTDIDNWKEYHTAGIEKDDVYIKPHDKSYGLEEEPHVTVLYGFHEDEIDEETISSVMKQNLKPITLRVDEVDVFEGDDYDVVKYNLPVTKELQEYRDLFMKFPNTQSFPDYKPHMTIAYVKPGEGKKYKRKLRDPFDVTFTRGVYSFHEDPNEPEDFSTRKVNLEQKYDKTGKIVKQDKVNEAIIAPSEEKEKLFKETLIKTINNKVLSASEKLSYINKKLKPELIKLIPYSFYRKHYAKNENLPSEIPTGQFWGNLVYQMMYITSDETNKRDPEKVRGEIWMIINNNFFDMMTNLLKKGGNEKFNKVIMDYWETIQHELIHREQDWRSNFSLTGSTGDIEKYLKKGYSKDAANLKATADYYSNPHEIMAHAYSTIIELKNKGISKEKIAEWLRSDEQFDFMIPHLPQDMREMYRKFLKPKAKKLFLKYLSAYYKKIYK